MVKVLSVFQFQEVQLKVELSNEERLVHKLFQFQEVQLKVTAISKSSIWIPMFQFQEVQLKAFHQHGQFQIFSVSIPRGAVKRRCGG